MAKLKGRTRPDPAYWFLARTNTLKSPPKQTDQYQLDHDNYTKYHRVAYSLMLADIKDRDRYCKQTDEEIFVVKLCAGDGVVEHLLIVVTGLNLRLVHYQLTPLESLHSYGRQLAAVTHEWSDSS